MVKLVHFGRLLDDPLDKIGLYDDASSLSVFNNSNMKLRDANHWEALLEFAKQSEIANDFSGAENIVRVALRIANSKFAPNHLNTAKTLLNLGDLLVMQDKFVEAEASYNEALRIYRAEVGEENKCIGLCLRSLAELYEKSGREDAALTSSLLSRSKILKIENPLLQEKNSSSSKPENS